MERAGIAVDRGAMAGMSEEFGHAMDELLIRIHAAAGHPFNVASTRELAQVLFEELKLPVLKQLKTGPSTDQDVLEKLAEQHAAAARWCWSTGPSPSSRAPTSTRCPR